MSSTTQRPQRIPAAALFVISAIAWMLVGSSGWAQGEQGQTTDMRPAAVLPPANLPQPTLTEMPSEPSASQGAAMAGEQPAVPPASQPLPTPTSPARAELGVTLFPSGGPGVRIGGVIADSAAAAAGLQPGDFILSISGHGVATPQDVIQQIRPMQPGQSVEIRIWRDRTEQTVTATLQESRRGESPREYVPAGGYVDGPAVVYYRAGRPINRYRRHRAYYPSAVVPYGYYGRPIYVYPYSYGYYGAPRFNYYRSPWGRGVRVGPFGFGW